MVGRLRSKDVSAPANTANSSEPSTSRQQPAHDPGTTSLDPGSDSDTGRDIPPGPQRGKNGPGALKHVCHQCRKKKWVVDFKEGKSADLTRLSKCLFCELQLTIEKQAGQIRTYEKALEEMRAEMSSQEKRFGEKIDCLRAEFDLERAIAAAAPAPGIRSPTSLPAQLVSRLETQESRTDLISRRISFLEKTRSNGVGESVTERGGRREASVKKHSPAVSYAAAVKSTPKVAKVARDLNNNEAVAVVKKTRSERRRAKPQASRVEVPPASRPANLLVGDSLVGKQAGSRFRQLRQENGVLSFPGAKIDRICSEIARLDIDRSSTLIVSVGGNDLFLPNKRSGNTERIAKDFERLLQSIKKKVNRAVVVGLLPRKFGSREQYSKAFWLNGRLSSLCKAYSLRYLNLWNTFFGRDELYCRDGIHFSGRGCTLFAEQLNRKLFKPLKDRRVPSKEVKEKRKRKRRGKKKSARSVQPPTTNLPPVTPATSAAGIGVKPKTPVSTAPKPGTAKRYRSQTVTPEDVAVKRHRMNCSGSNKEVINLDPSDPDDPSDSSGGFETAADKDEQGNGQASGVLQGTSG